MSKIRRHHYIIGSAAIFLVSAFILMSEAQSATGYAVKWFAQGISGTTTMILAVAAMIIALISLTLAVQMPDNEEMKKMISRISVALNNNETTNARMMYIKLRNAYNKLPRGDKEKHREECMKAYQKLVAQITLK